MSHVPSPSATPRPASAEPEAAPGGGPAVPQVAVVADDLTGAADSGAVFLRAGLSVTVTWDTEETSAATADVLAIDTATRRLPAAQAAEITARVVAGLREQGVPTLYKKVDSTLRGQGAAATSYSRSTPKAAPASTTNGSRRRSAISFARAPTSPAH